MTAIHCPLGERGRVAFAAGRLSAKRAELANLQARAEQARQQFARYPSHNSEIDKVRAEQNVDDFLAANPGLNDA